MATPFMERTPTATQEQAEAIYSLIPEPHRQMFKALWMEDFIPFGGMKLENGFTQAVGILFNLRMHRSMRSKRRQALLNLCARAGNPSAADLILPAVLGAEQELRLLGLPLEVIAVDVTSRAVREVKSYIRVNIARERMEDGAVVGSITSPSEEMAAMEAIVGTACPDALTESRRIVTALTGPRVGIEGVGIDIHGTSVETKLYFSPRVDRPTLDPAYHEGKTFTSEEAATLTRRALALASLENHTGKALSLVERLSSGTLVSSSLAVEIKPDGGHEVKLDFNHRNARTPFAGGVLPREHVEAAMNEVYKAAEQPIDEFGRDSLLDMVFSKGFYIDNFTTDFSAGKCGAKSYLSLANDRTMGILPPA